MLGFIVTVVVVIVDVTVSIFNMAYRRMKRFRRYRRRSYGRRFRRNFVRRVRRITGAIAEKKYWQYSLWNNSALYHGYGSADIADTSNIRDRWTMRTLIAGLPVGAADGQRIGSKIFVKYIQLTVFLHYKETTTGQEGMMTNGCICRYGVWLDRNHGSAVGPGVDIFELQNTPALSTVYLDKNRYTMAKYKTLLDKQHQMHWFAPGANAPGSGSLIFKHYIPINRQFQFRTAGTDMYDSSNLPIRDLVFGAASTHDAMCRLNAFVRICYTDM